MTESTIIFLAVAAAVGAVVALVWWIEVGSDRRHRRQAFDETLREFRAIHGPDWQPPCRRR